MKIESDLLQDIYVLLHPIRYRIVELLAEKPMQIDEVSNALGEEKGLVSYHLLTLEEHGFLSCNYELSISKHQGSKVKAIRKYRVTEKVEEVILKLKMRI